MRMLMLDVARCGCNECSERRKAEGRRQNGGGVEKASLPGLDVGGSNGAQTGRGLVEPVLE